MGISNYFNHETGTAGYDWLKSFLAEESRVVCKPRDKYPSLARAQRMNRKLFKNFQYAGEGSDRK